MRFRFVLLFAVGMLVLALCSDRLFTAEDKKPVNAGKSGDISKKSPAADKPSSPATTNLDVTKGILSGQVVFLSDALKRNKIKAYEKELKDQVVLETASGELWPIVPDWRGRAFYQDERLRNRPVDLLVNRRRGVPYLQVLSIYTFDEKGARQLTDYWCDICSIPMYEIKDCECCQRPIRLRFQTKDLPADVKPITTSP